MPHDFRLTRVTDPKRKHGLSRTRYSKQTERTIFFILTIAMLMMGLLVKANIW